MLQRCWHPARKMQRGEKEEKKRKERKRPLLTLEPTDEASLVHSFYDHRPGYPGAGDLPDCTPGKERCVAKKMRWEDEKPGMRKDCAPWFASFHLPWSLRAHMSESLALVSLALLTFLCSLKPCASAKPPATTCAEIALPHLA